MPTNPLRDVYDNIFLMLESNDDFTDLFPHGTVHQLRYNSDLTYEPDPDDNGQLAPADYPRCRITMKLGKPGTERDSNGSYLYIVYTIEVCTGLMQQGIMFDAVWAIYRACLSWRQYVLQKIWNGEYPVVDVDATQVEAKDDDTKRNRGTYQWIAVYALEIKMRFTTSVIKGT